MAQDPRTENANPHIHVLRLPRSRTPLALALMRRGTAKVRIWLTGDRFAGKLPRADAKYGAALAKSSLSGPLPQGGLNSERERGYA